MLNTQKYSSFGAQNFHQNRQNNTLFVEKNRNGSEAKRVNPAENMMKGLRQES
jgi:hypothetical protein